MTRSRASAAPTRYSRRRLPVYAMVLFLSACDRCGPKTDVMKPSIPTPAPATGYAAHLDLARETASTNGVRISCSMNPKAQQGFRAEPFFSLYMDKQDVVAVSFDERQAVDFAIRFRRDRIQIVDNTTGGVVEFVPADPSVNIGSRGLMAEIIAMRYLIAASAPSKMLGLLKGQKERELSSAEALELLHALYPDAPDRTFASGSTRLVQTTEGRRNTISWKDSGGDIFRVEVETPESVLTGELKRFEWAGDRSKAVPRPRMSDLLVRLRDAGLKKACDSQILLMTNNGTIPAPLPQGSTALVVGEMASVLHGQDRVACSIGGMSPYEGPLQGVHSQFRPVPIDVKDVKCLKSYKRSAEVPDAVLFCLKGQDWCISFSLSNDHRDLEALVSKVLAEFVSEQGSGREKK